MKKLLFVIWSLVLVTGNMFAEANKSGEIKSETKGLKEAKESPALNCTGTGTGGL